MTVHSRRDPARLGERWERRRIPLVPTTRPGTWAVALAIASLVPLMAGGARFGFAGGIAGGALALLAILARGERAISVFAALIPLVLVLGFVVAELVGAGG